MGNVLGTLNIDMDDEGQFWLSLEGADHLGRRGPFETELEAANAATGFIEQAMTEIANHMLQGDKA